MPDAAPQTSTPAAAPTPRPAPAVSSRTAATSGSGNVASARASVDYGKPKASPAILGELDDLGIDEIEAPTPKPAAKGGKVASPASGKVATAEDDENEPTDAEDGEDDATESDTEDDAGAEPEGDDEPREADGPAADGDGDEGVSDAPAAGATAAGAEPSTEGEGGNFATDEDPDAEAPEAVEERRQSVARLRGELQELSRKITPNDKGEYDFDPFTDTPKLLKTLLGVVGHLEGRVDRQGGFIQRAKAEAQDRAYWESVSEKTGVQPSKVKAIYNEEVAKLTKRGLKGEVLRGAAFVAFEHRLATLRGQQQARKAAASAAPDVLSTKPSVLKPNFAGQPQRKPAPKPVAGTGKITAPPQRAKTVDEKLAAGEYGNLASLA